MSIPPSIMMLVVLVLMLLGSVPSWPYSRAWGYGPSVAVATALLVMVDLVLLGRI